MKNSSYSKNPFYFLRATPRDDRATLVEKARNAVLLYGISDSEAEDALQSLLLPRKRLEAEMNWFPETKEEDILKILNLKTSMVAKPFPELSSPSAVARFNALSIIIDRWHQAETEDGFYTACHLLAKAHHLITPSSVIASLNHDREKSGFPKLDLDEQGLRVSVREEIISLGKTLSPGSFNV